MNEELIGAVPMVAPTNRELTETDALLDDSPQRSASVFCSLSFSLLCFIHFLISKQYRGVQEYSSESSAKKWWSMEKLWIRSKSCLVYNENRNGPSTDPCRTPREERSLHRNGPFYMYPLRSA